MRLTIHTDYIFRTLIFLTVNNERLCTVDEIAKAYKISKNHLFKVVNTLVKAGFVETIRGKGGGLRLAKNLEGLSLGAIIRITEPDFALVECFLSKNSCVITPICQLKHILNQAVDNFLKELDNYNLNELISNKEKISLLFNELR